MNEENTKITKDDVKAKIRKRYAGIDPDLLEVIPAKEKPNIKDTTTMKRVAIYVRVSTDDPNQTTSFELQKNYYDDIISKNPSYNLVGMYADEHAIIGTSGENLVKSRVSALVPFNFFVKGKYNFIKKSKYNYGRMCKSCQKQSRYAIRKAVSQRLPLP